jgi:hypothetical protein
MQVIYSNIPQTNHVATVYSVAAVLYLQSAIHVMLFRPWIFIIIVIGRAKIKPENFVTKEGQIIVPHIVLCSCALIRHINNDSTLWTILCNLNFNVLKSINPLPANVEDMVSSE